MIMKKWNLITIMMVALFSIGFASCSDDDESGDGTPTSGKWYLVTWDSNVCDHGEYMFFKGSKVEWNSRMGGKNTTYDCKVSGSKFYLTNCSDGSKDISFTIDAYTDNEMLTTSTDGIVRTWKR